MVDSPASVHNAPTRYGVVAKGFHWATAALILVNLPLGLVADRWPQSGDALSVKAQLFSLHKTLGVAIFFVALLRILWALIQPKPAPIHPARRVETFSAEVVHWTLYAALVILPLSGWIHHASSQGFAPILWPLGQSLPLVPRSDAVYAASGAVHVVFAYLLVAALTLHVTGAVKHAVLDRDGTLSRMWFGRTQAGDPDTTHRIAGPAATGAAVVVAALLGAWTLTATGGEDRNAAALGPATGGNWAVDEGRLGLAVQQFGNAVDGNFGEWTADIVFDPAAATAPYGRVTVTVAVGSLTLGSVTEEALAPDYLAAETYDTAIFEGEILPAENADADYVADGTLTLRGIEAPLRLPFDLAIDGDTARMTATTTVQRTTWEVGGTEADSGPVGPEVEIDVDLIAMRR